jgi:RNA polymerase primary sigma factor
MNKIQNESCFPHVEEGSCQKYYHSENKHGKIMDDNTASDTGDRQLQKKNLNLLSAYLKEINKWPILTRQQEQSIAKRLHESEHAKKVFTDKWLLLLSSLINRRIINKPDRYVTGKSNRKVLKLIQSIKEIANLNKDLKSRERSISKGDLTYYRRNKLCREKADLLIRKQQILKPLHIVKLYKSGTVKQLKPFIKPDYPDKKKKELIQILRHLTKFERKAKKAKDVLVRSNLRLVVMIAKKYTAVSSGLLLIDLIQEGNMGLIRAVEKFDYRLGNRISTYAVCWIRQSILRAIENKYSTIRIPIYVKTKLNKIFKKSKETDDPDNVGSLDFTDKWSLETFLSLQSVKDPISLNTPYTEDGNSLYECIPASRPQSPLEQTLKYQLIEIINETLKGLPPREERILRLRFGLADDFEHSLNEIGEEFGISRERIRQIESAALKRLSASNESEILRSLLTDGYN